MKKQKYRLFVKRKKYFNHNLNPANLKHYPKVIC
jgi:hypothetical protein